MRRASKPMPTLSGRTRSSLPSTARCRPTATRSMVTPHPLFSPPTAAFSVFSRIWTARQPSPRRPGERLEGRLAHDEPSSGLPRGVWSRRAACRVMRDLWTALALVLVIEGALYTLFPEGMKRAAARALAVPPQTLRLAGLGGARAWGFPVLVV